MTRKPRPAADAGALDPERLFARLAGRRGLILAVSGGPDSTALMVLMSRWRARPPALVVAVDHGLRPEAAGEARLVAANAERLNLPSRIMRVGEPQSGNLQDWARRVRYACLVSAAHEAGYDTIVTAHHEDDQAETFLLRLARGSGVYGLAAMRDEERLDDVLLARPLLAVPRAELDAIVHESGLKTVADPSNLDPRFDRVRIRKLMPALAEHGLTSVRLAETAARLRRAAQALDLYATHFLQAHFQADAFGVVRGEVAAFKTVPEEVALRSLARILRAVGGADYTPQLSAVELLHRALATEKKLKRTLSGVLVEVLDGQLMASREWGRAGLPETPVSRGETLLWDGRFQVEIPALAGMLSVGPLGRSGRRFRAAAARRAAVEAVPGLYRNGKLVAAPIGIEAADEDEPLAGFPVKCLVGQRLGLADGAPE